ncbi:alpha-amylase family glycosyl hydrolase [Arenimonas sp. MALMAid1274]|uniref:alpha-amylase family glycosyl hydrolase n=1 Tax=Arenimonas sp. MALMAid1274 TaxID=3411630 RepID=UPI003B9DE31E
MKTSPLQRRLCLAAALLCAGPLQAADTASDARRVDWRDQVLYFVMIDRFDDGDAGNNDQGAGEYDPASGARFSGGDLAGLTRRLDYVRGLGVTGVWITPPVANQWWDGKVGYGGYHGYWAADFKAVDAHFGNLADYRALADALHGRDMTLVQDIVVNHTGNFFSYDATRDPDDPTVGYQPNTRSRPMTAPTQSPFSLNDPRRAADRAAGIYHWTPRIADFTQRRQELDYALADLDDLDTENPRVRQALRDSYGHWIREVGVDAFRVDTAFHVPAGFFRDFLHSGDATAPGILAVARAAGKPDFHVFGEGFGVDKPYADTLARKIDGYLRDADGPLLPGMINFPLYSGLGDAFARGRPTAELAHRIRSSMALHANPHLMPTFVDNHDVERFLAGGSEPALKQALLAMMTLPGIPVVYYGTEQGLRGQREAMFAGGHGNGGRDRFDTAAPLYRYLADIIGLRRAQPLFSRGAPTVLRDSAAGPGVLAWRTDHEGQSALVVFNSDDRPRLLDNLDSGLPAGTTLTLLHSITGEAPAATLDAQGRLTLVLPPRAGLVWRADVASARVPATASSGAIAPRGARLTLDAFDGDAVRGPLALRGRAEGVEEIQLLVDGALDAPLRVQPGADGRWQASLDTARWVDPAVQHRVVAWSPTTGTASEGRAFSVDPDWRIAGRIADPAGDDTGPTGRYVYPTGDGWREHRPGDLRAVQAEVSGGSLRLTLEMAQVIADWNPPNGFDHVNFTIYLTLPRRSDGARVLPLQQASLPDGQHWHYRFRLGGWTSAGFLADGATATDEGRGVIPAPQVGVDRDQRTITVTLPAESMGAPATLDGAQVYVTTWDYDGGYRPLQPEAAGSRFGGGGADAPKVLDDARLVLRTAD